MSSAALVVYAFGMQQRTPFIFSMPPLYAWPLAFMTSIALLLATALVFSDGSADTEMPADNGAATQETDEEPAETRQASPVEAAVYIGLLVLPVGLIPMMARRKRMNSMRWSIAGVGVGFIQLITQIIFVHPLMVLLALVYLRPPLPTAPAAAMDVPPSASLEATGRRAAPTEAPPAATTSTDAPSADTQPEDAPDAPARRRPPRRRRRRF